MMPEAWTGRLVGKMHNARVTQQDLAKELGVSRGYVAMVLNSMRRPANAQKTYEEAFERIKERKKNDP